MEVLRLHKVCKILIIAVGKRFGATKTKEKITTPVLPVFSSSFALSLFPNILCVLGQENPTVISNTPWSQALSWPSRILCPHRRKGQVFIILYYYGPVNTRFRERHCIERDWKRGRLTLKEFSHEIVLDGNSIDCPPLPFHLFSLWRAKLLSPCLMFTTHRFLLAYWDSGVMVTLISLETKSFPCSLWIHNAPK